MKLSGVVPAVALLLSLGMHSLWGQTNRWPARSPGFRGFGPQRPGPIGTAGWDNKRRIALRLDRFDLATNFVVAKIETGEQVPNQIACVVKRLGSPVTNAMVPFPASVSGTNLSPEEILRFGKARLAAAKSRRAEEEVDWQQATWIPFAGTLPIDLGPGEGRRLIWIAAKWTSLNESFQRASGTHVRVRCTPPIITITNPIEAVTSRPMIQLQGYTDEPVQRIRYDLQNASNHVSDAEGFVNDQYYDPMVNAFSTNYFSCYDIELAPGTNTIELRCQDLAGNVATNILTYFFTLEGDKTPPAISLDSPINGHQLSSDTFTARGRLDDPTAQITARIWTDGGTNVVEGLVERDGYFWVEPIPLGAGANRLALTATDAAGNSSQTNLVVYRSNETLTIDSIPVDQLWNLTVTIAGRVSPPRQGVWVNGVEAKVKPDGSWVAERVPVLSPNGGTAVFEATTVPPSGERAPAARPQELVSVVAGLGTNPVTLNPSRPSCGAFSLHLTGTAGRAFVLYASTNLTDWTPILTNRSSSETFDFTDTEATTNKCRFFRVSPLP